MPTVQLLIKGKVQGVFYRATAKEKADELQVKGWVRNTDEGHVQACVTGAQPQLEEFINWCKVGPRKAIVQEVLIQEREEQSFDIFTVLRNS